ncbi:Cytochrome eukaryote [Cordyceps militaris]|uniref:Cytochrome eukaryote n=1 Tax=Cordyceps militaris TaxID=73501 RepID=A0A2H4SEM3_CORMI|nr:Cytochrome eukaryote [Cordyceps militaris]
MASTALPNSRAPRQRNSAAQVRRGSNQDGPRQQDTAFSMAQLWDGTGFIAQTAVVTFSLSLAGRLLARPLSLFSWHPLSQLLGLVTLLQSILVLQPTHDAGQKRVGQAVHAWLNLASFAAFSAGFAAIYLNKERSAAPHFASLHGALGAALTMLLWAQYAVGFTMWATPALYGGEARARALWKLHRAGGYANLLLILATFGTAADTGFVRNVLKVERWVFYVPMALIAVGVLPRVHVYKMGFGKRKA